MSTKPESADSTVELAKKIISISSISPDSSGVQKILSERLASLGFSIREMPMHGCHNFWARFGKKTPLIVFSGHTDVVAPGDEKKWTSPPFKAASREGNLFGRGAADMKGSVAAAITAVEEFAGAQKGEWPFSVGFLITGDEELGGISARECLEQLKDQKISFCIVGEPSSEARLGDTMKVGRRGSLTGKLEIFGKQGHVGYPHLAENALHRSFEPLLQLAQEKWDEGNQYFQPTTLQITSVQSGVAGNVIPGEAIIGFNFRFSVESTAESLQQRVEQMLKQCSELKFKLSWTLDSTPYLNEGGVLAKVISQSVKEVCGIDPAPSTAGGISDGRYFAKLGIPVVEIGPINKSIHQIDEHVSIADLQQLSKLYKTILMNLAKEGIL